MKRVAILAAVLLSGAAFAAEQWTPERVAQEQEKLAAATKPFLKGAIRSDIAVRGGSYPESYAEIEQKCIEAFTAVGLRKYHAQIKACFLACFVYPEYVVDAYKVAKANKNMVWWRIILNRNSPLVLSDEQRFCDLAECMLSGCENDPKNVRKVISEMLRYTPSVEDAKAKKILTDLNRYFSAKIALDKAAWEPVVAQIRTVLATY